VLSVNFETSIGSSTPAIGNFYNTNGKSIFAISSLVNAIIQSTSARGKSITTNANNIFANSDFESAKGNSKVAGCCFKKTVAL